MTKLNAFYGSFNTQSTVSAYRWALEKYQSALKIKDLDQYLEEAPQEKLNDDLKTFYASIKASPPKTVGLLLTAIRQAFLWYNRDPAVLRMLLGRRSGVSTVLTVDRAPLNEELHRIFEYLALDNNERAVCFFSALATSGARFSEILSLQWPDVSLGNPTCLTLRKTKTMAPRLVFVDRYTTGLLRDFQSSSAGAGGKGEKGPVFPFYYKALFRSWNRALSRAGLDDRDPTTNRIVLHPHTLRKRFRTVCGPILARDILETLLGHSGYLDSAYVRYTPQELAREYMKAEPLLKVVPS